MRISRRFTKAGDDVYAAFEWTTRSSRITNADGSTVFEMNDAEVPVGWSQLATDIVVSKYFRKAGVPQFDDAIRQAVALAAPFPEPPSEGLGPDGSFELPGEFVIPIGRAAADMSGIDPRAGVQFPGLVNVPR